MLILSVDPGVGGTGWALLRADSGRLEQWGTLHGRGNWAQKARQIMIGFEKLFAIRKDYIGQVYIESPVFMRGYGGYTTASSGDLVKLAMLCGAMYLWSLKREQHGVMLVEPSKWKGQLPKKICNDRVLAILNRMEPYTSTAEIGRISNHALDAIGLGLWALGKFK